MIYKPEEVREEACLVTFMLNFAGREREREKETGMEMDARLLSIKDASLFAVMWIASRQLIMIISAQ